MKQDGICEELLAQKLFTWCIAGVGATFQTRSDERAQNIFFDCKAIGQ